MKKIIHTLHLWLGLISGIIIIIISLTGCLYAFKTEIENIFQSYRHVTPEAKSYLPPSRLQSIAESALPGKHAHSVEYGLPDRAAFISFYDDDYYDVVFLNPYNGTVLKTKDMDRDFFRIVLMGHYYLWLPSDIGQPIIASATLIFMFMLISGIILWWPRNKHAIKQRFTIKWSARWRRKNYDLHNVLGFYACWIAIFLAITGLVWGFEWFGKGFYTITGGQQEYVNYYEPLSDSTFVNTKREIPAVDQVWEIMRKDHPKSESIEVHYPEHHYAIGASSNEDAYTHWKTDYRYFDQYTLKEIPVTHAYGRFNPNMDVADTIRRMNYDIHVGSILGLSGKFLAFFASLICASLPVTGFMIWWGRKYKK